MPNDNQSASDAFRAARQPTIAFTKPEQWVAWSQARPDNDPELTIQIFERGQQQFHGHVAMIAEMARLQAQFGRVAQDFRDREEAQRKALAYFSLAYQKDPKYRANLVEAIRFHYDIRDFSAAEKIYSFAFKLWSKPDGTVELNAFHYEKLGDVYNKLNCYDLARACYGMALQAPDLNWGKTMNENLAEKLEEMELWSNKKFTPEDWPLVMRSMAALAGPQAIAEAAGRAASASAYPSDSTGLFKGSSVNARDVERAAGRDERDDEFDTRWDPDSDDAPEFGGDGPE